MVEINLYSVLVLYLLPTNFSSTQLKTTGCIIHDQSPPRMFLKVKRLEFWELLHITDTNNLTRSHTIFSLKIKLMFTSQTCANLIVQFPRFVAKMTMGEMVDSSARCKYVKHSISNICTWKNTAQKLRKCSRTRYVSVILATYKSTFKLIHYDSDRSWITDPDPDHPKGTHPSKTPR